MAKSKQKKTTKTVRKARSDSDTSSAASEVRVSLTGLLTGSGDVLVSKNGRKKVSLGGKQSQAKTEAKVAARTCKVLALVEQETEADPSSSDVEVSSSQPSTSSSNEAVLSGPSPSSSEDISLSASSSASPPLPEKKKHSRHNRHSRHHPAKTDDKTSDDDSNAQTEAEPKSVPKSKTEAKTRSTKSKTKSKTKPKKKPATDIDSVPATEPEPEPESTGSPKDIKTMGSPDGATKVEAKTTASGWTASQHGILRGMREGKASWGEIAKALGKGKKECQKHWKSMDKSSRQQTSDQAESISELALGAAYHIAPDPAEEWGGQQEYLLNHIYPGLYPGLYPGGYQPMADEFFGEHDQKLLGLIRDKVRRSRLLEMQANFCNATGRMIPLHILARRCDMMKEDEEARAQLAAQEDMSRQRWAYVDDWSRDVAESTRTNS